MEYKPETSAVVTELKRLDGQIDTVQDLNSLKPIFYRLEEVTRDYPDDFDVQMLISDIKQRAPDQVQALILEHLGLVHSLAGDERRSSQHMTTAISLINGGAQPSIAASLERIVQMRMLPA